MPIDVITLRTGETIAAVDLGSRSAGTYYQKLSIQGNSLLSTIFIESIDVGTSLNVSFHETTTGEDAGEIVDLNNYVTLTSAHNGESIKLLVTRIHNKPYIKYTITGAGQARFGLYVTVVNETASDIDSALVLDGQTADLTLDKGLQSVLYDADQNKFYFLRGSEGYLEVSQNNRGATFIYSGSVGTTAIDLPPSSGKQIKEMMISCTAEQSVINKLLFSIDNGTTFHEIKMGNFISWPIRGDIQQIKIKGSTASVNYQVFINREP